MIFTDASALVAMMAGEDGAERMGQRLQTTLERLCSPMAIWETVAALRRSHGIPLADARQKAEGFKATFGLRLVTIGERELELALDAYGQYGKGRHKAALNMGDCFAYACARAHGARLLYIGDDFAQTDLAWVD